MALFIALDGVQGVAQGIARGAAKQHFGAAFVIGANYGISLPLGAYFAFVRHWGLFGLWAGLFCGYLVLNAAFAVLFACMSWERASEQAVRGASDSASDGHHALKGIPTEEGSCDEVDLECEDLDGDLQENGARGDDDDARVATAKKGEAKARAGGKGAQRRRSAVDEDSVDVSSSPLQGGSNASGSYDVEMQTLDVMSPELQVLICFVYCFVCPKLFSPLFLFFADPVCFCFVARAAAPLPTGACAYFVAVLVLLSLHTLHARTWVLLPLAHVQVTTQQGAYQHTKS